MFLLAHTGITLAAARGFEKITVLRKTDSFPGLIDYRLVLIGSLLPDIIDKPLSGIVLRDTFSSGRIFSHTLVFFMFLFVLGIYFWGRSKRPSLLVLAGGSLFHDLLDSMWHFGETFLWPIYGWRFPPGNPDEWLSLWVKLLLNDPYVYVPEITGGVIILLFLSELIVGRKLRWFIATGKINRGLVDEGKAMDITIVDISLGIYAFQNT